MLQPEIQQKVDAFLNAKGLRRTRQREVIIDAAFSTTSHFTAEQLWEKARKLDPETSRATVYRTLALLVEGNLLTEIDLGGEQTHYDPNFHDMPHHNHLICIDCSRVIEFEDPHMDTVTECAIKRLGFRSVAKFLRIEACCENLRLKGSCERLIDARLKKSTEAIQMTAHTKKTPAATRP